VSGSEGGAGPKPPPHAFANCHRCHRAGREGAGKADHEGCAEDSAGRQLTLVECRTAVGGGQTSECGLDLTQVSASTWGLRGSAERRGVIARTQDVAARCDGERQ
jgi:hypothetical protein